MKEEVKQLIDESLRRGWKMSKKIRESSSGLFSYTPILWDNRTVYNREDLFKLNSEGFTLESDAGILALNILLSMCGDK